MITINARLLLTLTAVFVLTILPLPGFIAAIRPAWVLLFVLYLQYYFPHYFRVTSIVFLGLCLDVLCSTAMGEHAFALLLTSWLVSSKVRRFTLYLTLQQMSLVFMYGLFYQGTLYLIDSFLGNISSILSVIGIAFTTMICWPWVNVLSSSSKRSHYDI